MTLPGRWQLDVCSDTGAWDYLEGNELPASHVPLRFRVDIPGQALDFTLSYRDAPVVTTRLGHAIEALVGPGIVQRIPTTVDGASGTYEIVNSIVRVDCVDEARSTFRIWGDDDGAPELVGQYHGIYPLRVAAARIPPHVHLFRIERYSLALIASQRFVDMIRDGGFTGTQFTDVT